MPVGQQLGWQLAADAALERCVWHLDPEARREERDKALCLPAERCAALCAEEVRHLSAPFGTLDSFLALAQREALPRDADNVDRRGSRHASAAAAVAECVEELRSLRVELDGTAPAAAAGVQLAHRGRG
eukprot:scaffold84576_cov27-Tisochrysis_lutea.AAC.1